MQPFAKVLWHISVWHIVFECQTPRLSPATVNTPVFIEIVGRRAWLIDSAVDAVLEPRCCCFVTVYSFCYCFLLLSHYLCTYLYLYIAPSLCYLDIFVFFSPLSFCGSHCVSLCPISDHLLTVSHCPHLFLMCPNCYTNPLLLERSGRQIRDEYGQQMPESGSWASGRFLMKCWEKGVGAYRLFFQLRWCIKQAQKFNPKLFVRNSRNVCIVIVCKICDSSFCLRCL